MNGKATVLIVEDNVDIAEMTCETIELCGVTAVYRTSVADALDYIARHAPQIVALFTDINLASPMTGIELAIFVAQEWPEIDICATSGFSLERPRRLPAKATFMAKPWSSTEIHAFVTAAAQRGA